MGKKQRVAESLEGLAAVMLAQEQTREAACLWGVTQAMREQIGVPLPPNEREKYEQQVGQARSVLGEDAFVSAWGEGRAMSWEQAVVSALRKHE
jgi:hypothetical protein